MNIEIDLTNVINNMTIDEEKIKEYGDYKKIATELLRENTKLSLEKIMLKEKNEKLQSKIDKTIKILNADTCVENCYKGFYNLLINDDFNYEIDNDEINNILRE